MAYLAQAWAVARKDLLLEARSRERFVSMATFAMLVAVVFSFALDPTVRSRDIAGAMLWVTVLFAGTLGLGRSFALEREADAFTGVLVSPVPRGAVFLGKFLANLLVVLAVEAVIFPVYALFFGLRLGGRAGAGWCSSSSWRRWGSWRWGRSSAPSRRTRGWARSLLPILLLPLLLPVVIFAASATQRLLVGRPLAEIGGNLRMLLAFDLIFLFVCTALFGAAVEE